PVALRSSTRFPYTTLFRSSIEVTFASYTANQSITIDVAANAAGQPVGGGSVTFPLLAGCTSEDVPLSGSMPIDMAMGDGGGVVRSEEHTSELQSHLNLVCR